mmetsp:Transcript_14291/g.38276  ORF Transcript_14291/g.38276 Transcript_14291/m.38276 type:complete len:266 (-) Transcript_14291:49-846(-)
MLLLIHKRYSMFTARRWNSGRVRMVIIAQQPSNSKAGPPQMFHVQIQIPDATHGESTNDLQLDRVERHPFRMHDSTLRHAVTKPSGLLLLCPRPRDVQLLEVHVRASTQPTRVGLHAEHRSVGGLSFGDVYQEVLARLHQIEALTMHVLQVGIALGRGCPAPSRARRSRRTRRRAGCRRLADGAPPVVDATVDSVAHTDGVTNATLLQIAAIRHVVVRVRRIASPIIACTNCGIERLDTVLTLRGVGDADVAVVGAELAARIQDV